MSKTDDIATCRERLSQIDREIVDLIAERQGIVKKIGRNKRLMGKALRDFKRERVVFESALEQARTHDLNPRLVEDVVRTLIQYSLENQEQDFVSSSSKWGGKTALVIGGCGKMGRWFAEMLTSQKFVVEIADPMCTDASGQYADWLEAGVDYDVIVVATPIAATNEILQSIARLKPRGLIFDVGSLKTPLREGLRSLADAGCKVTSLHPMFGPDTQLLSGKHLIFVDAGSPEATLEAKELFEDTMAEQIDMALDDHDQLVAFVLGLSHAINVVFFHALKNCGESAEKLMKLSSSTFDAQLLLSASVARENPDMYFDIQFRNEFGDAALEALCKSSDLLREIVRSGNRAGFVEIMQEGQKYLALRRKRNDESRHLTERRRRRYMS